MFYGPTETVLLFGLCYLHLDLFQFLCRYLSLHVQFCSYVFQGKIAPSSGRQVFLFLKLYTVITQGLFNDYSR